MDAGIESVYNLIPQEYIKPRKEPRHESKFKSTVKLELKEGRHEKKTLGPAKLSPESPEKYLKKGTGAPPLPDAKKFTYPDQCRKPRVPKHNEKPILGLQSKKNFINTNAVENIMSVPKKPVPKFVDTRGGQTNLLEPSGLVPKYLKKPDFGSVPNYIQQRNAEVKKAQKEYDDYVRERMKQGAMQELSEEERKDIIDGLKRNWEELHHQYQNLSVVTDTVTKRYRKERLESEMKQLELDIDLMERHKVIYISNY